LAEKRRRRGGNGIKGRLPFKASFIRGESVGEGEENSEVVKKRAI